MPTRRCCCIRGCPLGSDDFDRPDSDDPGPKWHEVEGDWDILGNTISGDGKLATTICHPTGFTEGSWQAAFDLVDVRSISVFKVGAGNPSTSTYRVEFTPSGMDTLNAKINVKVIGDETIDYDFAWPVGVGGTSANIVRAYVCYLPKVMIRADIGAPPEVDACAGDDGAPCYNIGGVDVGGFFFVSGRFDNWTYDTTILDNFNCDPCGCFCFKREGLLKEFACFPELLTVNFELVEGTCSTLDGFSLTLEKGQLSPGDGTPSKQKWYSEVQTCSYGAGGTWAMVLECTPLTKDGTNWFLAPSLRITDGSYISSTTVFIWEATAGSTVTPSFDLSTCNPLSMVYEGLKVQSQFGPCGAPGQFGYYPFCCPIPAGQDCYTTIPTIKFKITVTE